MDYFGGIEDKLDFVGSFKANVSDSLSACLLAVVDIHFDRPFV